MTPQVWNVSGTLRCAQFGKRVRFSGVHSCGIQSCRIICFGVYTIVVLLFAPLAPTLSLPVPSIIVGAGRIGCLLHDLGCKGDVLVRRGEPIPLSPATGPIYVCTRNDGLAQIVKATPPTRRSDLVFLQNGMLGSFLQEMGLAADATQALLYLAVPKVGAPPVDGITSLNPEGLTCATGKWAPALAARLAKAGLTCNICSGEAFAAAALEKHIFICCTNVVGQLHGGLTHGGVYEEQHADELQALISEMCAAGAAETGVRLHAGTYERLVAYGRSVADMPTGIKEFQWRNGWFHSISMRATEAGDPDPLPLHTAALKRLGVIK